MRPEVVVISASASSKSDAVTGAGVFVENPTSGIKGIWAKISVVDITEATARSEAFQTAGVSVRSSSTSSVVKGFATLGVWFVVPLHARSFITKRAKISRISKQRAFCRKKEPYPSKQHFLLTFSRYIHSGKVGVVADLNFMILKTNGS